MLRRLRTDQLGGRRAADVVGVRLLLLGALHVEDGSLANAGAKPWCCLAVLGRQRFCLHDPVQVSRAKESALVCEGRMKKQTLKHFERFQAKI